MDPGRRRQRSGKLLWPHRGKDRLKQNAFHQYRVGVEVAPEPNYEREDWLAVVLIYGQLGPNPGIVKQDFATAETISSPRYQARLRAANAGGADIYLTVNALRPGATGRTKADVETIRHVFLDLDGGGREAVDRIVQAPGMPAPHHILNTSPEKHQLIWSVVGFEKDHAEDLVRRLAARHGADQAVWDVARVLRIPGFRNHKYEAIRHFVQDVQDQPPLIRDYGPGDFPQASTPNAQGESSPRGFGPRTKTYGSGDSQSERDWAMVMNALKRGEQPQTIQAQLERSRQDKPNPGYYAKRTVWRAVQEYARSMLNSPTVRTGMQRGNHLQERALRQKH